MSTTTEKASEGGAGTDDMERIEALIATLSTDMLKERLADFVADEAEIGDWAEFARCWAIDSIAEGIDPSEVISVLDGTLARVAS